jgi:hypothetical protein
LLSLRGVNGDAIQKTTFGLLRWAPDDMASS